MPDTEIIEVGQPLSIELGPVVKPASATGQNRA
jgi:hypothetical protein